MLAGSSGVSSSINNSIGASGSGTRGRQWNLGCLALYIITCNSDSITILGI